MAKGVVGLWLLGIFVVHFQRFQPSANMKKDNGPHLARSKSSGQVKTHWYLVNELILKQRLNFHNI